MKKYKKFDRDFWFYKKRNYVIKNIILLILLIIIPSKWSLNELSISNDQDFLFLLWAENENIMLQYHVNVDSTRRCRNDSRKTRVIIVTIIFSLPAS